MREALDEKPKPAKKATAAPVLDQEKRKEIEKAIQSGDTKKLLESVLADLSKLGKSGIKVGIGRVGKDGKIEPMVTERPASPDDPLPDNLNAHLDTLQDKLKGNQVDDDEDVPKWSVSDPRTGRTLTIRACVENIEHVLDNARVVIEGITDPTWVKPAERILAAIEQFFYLQVDAVERGDKNLWANLSRELHNLHAALSHYGMRGGSPIGINLNTPGIEEEEG